MTANSDLAINPTSPIFAISDCKIFLFKSIFLKKIGNLENETAFDLKTFLNLSII